MNLRNGQISVREILQNPQARGLIQREVPQLAGMLNSPMAVAWQGMTLNAVAACGPCAVSDPVPAKPVRKMPQDGKKCPSCGIFIGSKSLPAVP